MGNPQERLTIPTIPIRFKMLRSMYVCQKNYFIICVDSVTLSNKKTELNSNCPHRNKILLANVRR